MPSETIANGTDRIIHRLDLNEYGLRDVPERDRQAVKQEVADYLGNQILREVNNGNSPVAGEGRFKRLDTDYALREKSGNRLSDLENEGDLLNDFSVDPSDNSFINIGHTGGETPKADGHNQLSSKAKAWARQNGFPKRRYIPDDNQKFTRPIVNEIRNIIDEFKAPEPSTRQVDAEPTISSTLETPNQSTVTIDNLFGDDVISALLNEALNRRDS